jgi:hypothetical protein
VAIGVCTPICATAKRFAARDRLAIARATPSNEATCACSSMTLH